VYFDAALTWAVGCPLWALFGGGPQTEGGCHETDL